MDTQHLPEKKKRLFDAVLALLPKYESASEIRISEVAELADIGKGTVYEYVSSKEQLLADALQYALDRDFSHMIEAMAQAGSWQEQVYVLLSIVGDCARTNLALAKVVFSSGTEIKQQEMRNYHHFEQAMRMIIRNGELQGCAMQKHNYHAAGALMAGVAHLLLYIGQTEQFPDVSYEQALRISAHVMERLLTCHEGS